MCARLKSKIVTSMLFLLCVIVLTGCGGLEPAKDREKVEEPLVNLEFKTKGLLAVPNGYIITTESQTFVWNNIVVDFIQSKDDSDKVTYEINKSGETFNGKIYLSPEGLKEYSKAYAVIFNDSLKVKKE